MNKKKRMIILTTTMVKTLDDKVFPSELQAILNSIPL